MSTYRTTRQRRSRYTVFLVGGEFKVILTYSAADARTYFERRGYKVSRVGKGDVRKQIRARQTQAEGGYRIDQKALKDAIAILGLKLPVRVRQHARVGNTNGNYRHGVTHHNIMIKSYLTPEQASKTLWHELTHAQQAERAGDYAGWTLESQQQRRSYAYWNRPIEVEARANADKYAPLYPICK